MIGETVGSYRLVEKLGEGGMGEVYSAEHKYIPRHAAIKFLLRELTGSSDLVRRFFAEARAASIIKHPGIVEVLDCEVHQDGRAYIVMELLTGESLREYLERVGKLDSDEAGALAICREMAHALGAAHTQGIVHRDLKPDNTFLHLALGRPPDEPIVKLLDFGIAKLQGVGETGSKTRTGQLLGTPLYMSPEQCRGARQVDSRSDIYSFGCIMYEIFCGRPPFIDEGFGDLIVAHVSQPPPEPLQLAPAMAPAAREIILRCLSKQPESRPASMDEVGAMLAAAGAMKAVRLQRPVVAPARSRGRGGAPGARSPAGFGLSPDRVATTPFPQTPRPSEDASRTTAPFAPVTPPQIGGTKIFPTPAPTTLGGGASEMLVPGARRRGGKKWAVVAASIVGLGAVVVLVLQLVTSRVERTAPAKSLAAAVQTPVESPATDPLAEPSATTRPTPRAEPSQSSIKLMGLPAGATVWLDDRLASLPLAVPRNLESHRLAVEADGFQRWEGWVNGATDQIVAVRLSPKRSDTHSPTQAKDTKAKDTKAKDTKARQRSGHTHGSPGFSGFDDL